MSLSKHKVFISFRGKDVRNNFLSFLEDWLKRGCVEYYVDHKEMKGAVLDILLQRIEESRLVLIILSKNYLDSGWCIKELLKIMENIEPNIETNIEPKLKVIPIFYNVTVEEVKNNWKIGKKAKAKIQENEREEMEKQVKEALRILTRHMGIRSADFRNDLELIENIVQEVNEVLTFIESKNEDKAVETIGARPEVEKQEEMYSSTKKDLSKKESKTPAISLFGIAQRLQKLKDKLKMESKTETRVVGVFGMAGIGKTTLVEMLYIEKKHRFQGKMFLEDVHKTYKENGPEYLRFRLLQKLVKNQKTITDETTHKCVEKELLEKKVFLILDDLSDKKELELLLGDQKWIKKGSKIVIVTSNKSLVDGLVDDTYVVPGLNEREGLDCFCYHAFGEDKAKSIFEGNFMKLSREFVDYARGNPLALKVLGVELHGRNEAHWESKLRQLMQSPSKSIQDVLNVSYDGLSQQQKEAFLDVTCYFRSENYKFVTSVVDNDSEIKDLADKFLIENSGGRLEMHGLLYTLGKKLASQQLKRLWKHQDIINVLKKKPGKIIVEGIRGMFLDMSEVPNKISLGAAAFDKMKSLRYIKFYDSVCHQECEADCKLLFPDGLDFGLQEIRYLHWLKFPLEELPADFNTKNLIDLKLPYSKIKRLWCNDKDTRNLKWVDLNHSSDLYDFSGLVDAQNLQRLNLEGCTELKTLPKGMENMLSLVVLNMRGCTSLVSLPEMNMKSLNTLILSDCSNLEDFQVISENLKALYLDGTSLKGLPDTFVKLQKLIVLNLKNCKSLEAVPSCLGNMKALQEVILSGCLKLKSYPDLEENMRRLRILLLDGTSIKEVPNLMQCSGISIGQPISVKGLPFLRHLCLRGNNMIHCLQSHIAQLYHLKCIDLKYCKKLISVPTLPPNLQCLDAHGCESLTTIGNPLAILLLTDQIHSTFIFSNCHKLDEVEKNGIISYIEKKSRLMSNVLNRYNLDSARESFVRACFPGCEVPAWFSHQTYDSAIVMPEFQRHWSDNKIIGVAVCAVISFTSHQDQNHPFLVKCTYEFKNKEDESLRGFSCTIGGNDTEEIKSEHVFIGYTSWLKIKKQKEEMDIKKGCSKNGSYDQAYLRIEVTDGTGEKVKISQVLKCGFSFVYESDDTDIVSWDVTDPSMGDEVKTTEKSEELVTNKSSEIQIQDETDDVTLAVTQPNTSNVVISPSGSAETTTSCASSEYHERRDVEITGEDPGNENIIRKLLRYAKSLMCNVISVCAGDSLMVSGERTEGDTHIGKD